MSTDCNRKSLSKWHLNCSHDIYNIVQESKLETFSSLLPKRKATFFSVWRDFLAARERQGAVAPRPWVQPVARLSIYPQQAHTQPYMCNMVHGSPHGQKHSACTWPQVPTVGPRSVPLSRWAGWKVQKWEKYTSKVRTDSNDQAQGMAKYMDQPPVYTSWLGRESETALSHWELLNYTASGNFKQYFERSRSC